MDEISLLGVFYNEAQEKGVNYRVVTISIDSKLVKRLKEEYGLDVTLDELEEAARTCLANEWLVRTTADPFYNYLSLSKEGLDVYKNF